MGTSGQVDVGIALGTAGKPGISAVADGRLDAIDGIRIVCAIWVVLYHFGPPPLDFKVISLGSHSISIGRLFSDIFCGAAAVIAFFLISGICINLPYCSGKPFDVRRFYLARMVRIGLPLIVAIAIANFVSNGMRELDAVLWSLYSELIYYFVYPLVLYVARRGALVSLTLFAYLLAILMNFVSDDTGGFFWSNGVLGSTLRGFPVWLSGCVVAQCLRDETYRDAMRVLSLPLVRAALRIAVLVFSMAAMALHFHSPIHYKWSLLVFSVVCMPWIVSELTNAPGKGVFNKVSGWGTVSYSVYLTHKIAFPITVVLVSVTDSIVAWLTRVVIVCVISLSFYALVEYPSHRLSRFLARPVRRVVHAGELRE